MDSEFYKEKLYPLQDRVLKLFRDVETGLYLTGDTAASRAYLEHRYSDDLDLFANDSQDFSLWVSRCIDVLHKAGEFNIDILLQEKRFTRIVIETRDVDMKIEFVNDVPGRVGNVRTHDMLGRIDSPENILANKITAVLDRNEPKDLADIWGFCTKMNLSLKDAITGAQGKAAGVFPPDVARVLLSTTEEDWKAIRWISAPPVNEFMRDIHRLGQSLLMIE
ncbi:MAG: nucleotidyl transferase AbiEii/AbiGii toxin family protein [Chlorobi bacterium]|nr:nucleotidyl transferase AbiEii/AbiGii toxin family protein [Chlorobiota bacterium]